MSLPLGHRIDGEFVCMECLRDDDHRPGGIGSGLSALDERVGSGKECSRCERVMPHLARVRLLPDGYSSIHAPKGRAFGRKAIAVERSEETLVDGHALVYITLGCDREVGLRVTPTGNVEVWIYDELYKRDATEPDARWVYEPERLATKGDGEP